MDHFNNKDGNVWPCVLGGMVVGGLAVFGLAHVWKPHSCCVKTKHSKAFLLIVNVDFASPEERSKFLVAFQSLADMVYAREKNCLSYEISIDVENPCKAIIVERYKSRNDLDGLHQETLALWRKTADSQMGFAPKMTLTRYEETNIGFMDPR